MNAGEVYQRYQTLANKAGNGGYATPERFALDYKQAEMQFFSTNYDNVKQYSKGNATPLFGYAVSQRMRDNLAPYQDTILLTPTKWAELGMEMGIVQLPPNYKHLTGFFATYETSETTRVHSMDCGSENESLTTKTTKPVEVKVLLPDEFGMRLGSVLKPPTKEYPIAKFVGDKILIAPYGVANPTLSFLRDPKGAIFGWIDNGVGKLPTYDPATSRDWEAPTDCHEEILNIMLGYLGISTGQESLPAYANRNLNEGT